MAKSKVKYILSLGIILFIVMLLVSGGAFAYFVWQSDANQQTALDINVSEKILMTINPPSVSKTGMRPTNACGGEASMSGVSTIIIDNQTGILARPRFKLKIKITDSSGNNITNVNSPTGEKYMYYVKYAISEEDGTCTSPLISGNFNGITETTSGGG